MVKARVLLYAIVLVTTAMPQTTRVKNLLPQLESSDPNTRMTAFDQLWRIPHVIDQPGVGPALWRLLALIHARRQAGITPTDDGLVADMVLQYVQNTGNLQPLPEVLLEPNNWGSLGSIYVAKLGPKVIQAVEQVEAGTDVDGRINALDVARIMLIFDRPAEQPLTPDDHTELSALVHKAVHDPSIYVRMNAVDALGSIGNPSDLPLLRQIVADEPNGLGKIARRALQWFGQSGIHWKQ